VPAHPRGNLVGDPALSPARLAVLIWRATSLAVISTFSSFHRFGVTESTSDSEW